MKAICIGVSVALSDKAYHSFLYAGQQTLKQYTAIKVLTNQLYKLNLSVELLMHRCELDTAIVIWRCEAVETLVSALIAINTGKW